MPSRTLFLLGSAILGLASLVGILFFLTQSSSDLTHLRPDESNPTTQTLTAMPANPAQIAQIQASETATPTTTPTPELIQREKITEDTLTLTSGLYFLRKHQMEDDLPLMPLPRFRGADPRRHVETRNCSIAQNEYQSEEKTSIHSDDWDWHMRMGEWNSGLYLFQSLYDRSHVSGSGMMLTFDYGDFEIHDCGNFERLPDLEIAEVIAEDGVYLTGRFVNGVFSSFKGITITPAYDNVVGLIETGTYANYGWSEYSLCMVYRVKEYPGLSQWILLGYGQQLLNIDSKWKGLATSGCGEWRLLTLSGNGRNSTNIASDEAHDRPGQESVWEYCARIGGRELRGDQIPDHIASDLQEITFHPMNGGPYTYNARCGYVEGSETATLLMCQSHRWPIYSPDIKWSPPTMGSGYSSSYPCLARPYQIGDSVTALFSSDVIDEICKRVAYIGNPGCRAIYEDHLRTGEKEYFGWTRFDRHPEYGQIASLSIDSYIFDEFLHFQLAFQEIDRAGYFSDLWFAVPEGCTGFETHEVGGGTYSGGFTEPEFFTFRGKCFQSQVGRTEVAWVIPEGRVKLPDSILEGTEN